jgi:hypothetical protein
MSLLIHPQTESRLKDFETTPRHAVLLVGPQGSGKLSLAHRLAESVLELPPNSLQAYAYAMTIAPEETGRAIGIEAVRELEHFLSLKVPGTATHHRAVIIEESHLMTTEAQNALLKILEEPPAGTIMVLTAANSQALLPTIRSRVQSIDVLAPALEPLQAYFSEAGFNSEKIKKSWTMSGGLPGLMNALLQEDEHPLLLATETARRLLIQTPYERLLQVDELAKQRALLLDTLFILQRMAHISLQTATPVSTRRWQNVLKASYAAAEALEQSAQPKLVLTTLMLAF